ncbi:hypothetical protein LK994_04425 [Ferruginibacter lapsinanis]|uniref:hypothetical protein n=1 Tax=Ferruginibacter lapsinanis TaxID=563172 RepID=UPI001E58B1F2|nr:hypothetical protein [Ferruginibacter lapsinanis]UEG50718.1 hypothetical protein LK994_04425 [Ferruginibacter lapsinanis]
MKKVIAFLSLAVVAMACTNDPKETNKDVIVIPATPAPPTQTIIVKDPPAKSTTVILDKKGVQVETKKVDVSIKP